MKCLLLLQIIRQLSFAWSEVKILQKYWLTKGSTHLNDAVVTCTMQSLTSPKQDHQEKQSNLSQASSKDCLSCRIWGGIVHLGIAGFVGSHVHQMPGRFSKAFVGLFSFGEKLRLFLHSIHPALAKTLIFNLVKFVRLISSWKFLVFTYRFIKPKCIKLFSG